jgi:hypothetical protein
MEFVAEQALLLEVRMAVRTKLRQDKVNLWEPPYSRDDGTSSVTAEFYQQYAEEVRSVSS